MSFHAAYIDHCLQLIAPVLISSLFVASSSSLLNPMAYYDRRPSLKEKLGSFSCFSCCFGGGSGDPLSPGAGGGDRPSSLLRSSSAWVRSRAQELPQLRERCRTLISRLRRNRGHFGYDPLDYARNFDEGEEPEDEAPLAGGYRNFSSRLPKSPLPPAAVGIGAT